jgi:membrane-associated phospholipid phosphatase
LVALVILKSSRCYLLFWLLGVAFVLLSAAAATGWLYSPDVLVMQATQGQPSDLLDALSRFFSALGTLEFALILLLALVAGLYKSGRRRLARRLLVAFLVTGLVEYLLKQFLPVPLIPPGSARTEDFAPLVTVDHSYPYPSGHALRSTILLGSVYLLSENSILRAGVVLALLGLLASRIYLGVHWPSDVVGGALLGAAAVSWAFGKEDRG